MPRDPHTISLRPTPPPEPPPIPPAPQPPTPPARRPRRRSNTGIYITIAVIAVLGIGAYAWNAGWFEKSETDSQNETTAAEEQEIKDIVARVEELIVLPKDEEPTIATVTDPEKLRDQVFFANAKEGDVVLIYTKAQKAYLYDPRIHKLIEVAPLTIQ